MSANGNYDFEFRLYDQGAGGILIGVQPVLNVPVVNGVFNVNLEFGATAFPGANRFLEIAVTPAGGAGFTVLVPRQQILSAPYSIKSLSADNAAKLGGINAANFVQQDAGGNVSIAGNFTVNGLLSLNTVNAQTEYQIGGQRIFGNAGTNNLFAGIGAGQSNTSGYDNAFFGQGAGQANTTGFENSFFGKSAGLRNTTGFLNSFFGINAGINNTIGADNVFIGAAAGTDNQTGSENTFVGVYAGQKNTAGRNSFFGTGSGQETTTGANNSFFGYVAGISNQTGRNNSFFGTNAGAFNNADFNSFFGSASGQANTTGTNNTFVGSNSGLFNETGSQNSFFGRDAGRNNTANGNSFFGNLAGQGNTIGSNNTIVGNLANVSANNLTNATAIGAGAVVSQSNALILGNNVNVGIGTSTPASKLTVVGLIETTTGGVKFPDGTVQTTASTSVSAILNQTTPQSGANFNIAGNGTVGGTLTANKVQAADDSFVLGNFGIGTAAPRAKLDVTGGNILIDTAGSGIILKSPDGNTCRLMTISDAGAVTLTPIACP